MWKNDQIEKMVNLLSKKKQKKTQNLQQQKIENGHLSQKLLTKSVFFSRVWSTQSDIFHFSTSDAFFFFFLPLLSPTLLIWFMWHNVWLQKITKTRGVHVVKKRKNFSRWKNRNIVFKKWFHFSVFKTISCFNFLNLVEPISVLPFQNAFNSHFPKR